MANKKNPFPKASRKNGQRSPNPIEEKGMEFFSEDGDFDETIVEIIKHYKWEFFVHPPGDFCLELVLEFYRNLNQENTESSVMGRRINFSPETINHSFGLESVNNELTHLLLAAPDWEEVEGKLCPFGANWVLKPSGERKYLIGTNIGYRSRPWQYQGMCR
uniref:Uncharacterized protein LOC104245352 n=1 Tax=Nicotiana sylvestris TaxID=4096 RepID=A0A1U7YJ09_NICSY|nr:PREDICTED: uncharacterized protein LOC104245352 [Nicotiana sylvestris]